MRSFALSLLLLFPFTYSARAQEGVDPPLTPEELKGQFRVYLETGGHFKPIVFASFTKNDKQLVTVGKEGSIQIWDVATGKRVRKFLLPVLAEYWGAALSPDDRTIAISVRGDGFADDPKKFGPGLLLVNLEDGRIIPLTGKIGPTSWVRQALAFSPAGDQLAAGGNGPTLQIWPKMDQVWDKVEQLPPEQQAALLNPRAYPPAAVNYINAIKYSPDGKHILVAGDKVGMGRIFEARPGGEANPGVPLQYLSAAQKNHLACVGWSVDSKTVLAGGFGHAGLLNRWSLEGGFIKNYGLPKDEKEKNFWLPAWARFKQLHTLSDATVLLNGFVFFHDNQVDTTYSGYIGASVLNLKTGNVQHRLKEPDLAEILSLTAVSHDKKLAVTTVNSGRELVLWKIADGTILKRIQSKAQSPVRAGWLKNKGRYVLAWGYGNDPWAKDFGKFSRAFDLDQLRFEEQVDPKNYTGRLHQLGPWSAAYKTKGSRDFVQIKKSGKDMAEVMQNGDGISAFTFVPRPEGGPLLAYEYYDDVVLADPATGKEIKKFKLRFTFVHDLVPSPDGKYLAVVTGTQVLGVLNIETGKLILDLNCHGKEWIVWTPSGHYAASPGGEKMMGWVASDSLKTQATFHPASRFRKDFYRPDLLSRIVKEGSFAKAWDAANTELKAQGKKMDKQVDLETVLPPNGFIDHVESSNLPKIVVKVSATAAHAKEPLTKLELLADGRLLFDKAGVIEFKEPQQNAKATFTVEVPPGTHKLTVRIHTKNSWSISTEAHVSYTPSTSAKQPKAKLHVLSVGASEYKNYKGLDLPSPANDAQKIAQALQAQCGPPLFAPGAQQTFIGKNATSTNVYQAIKGLKVEPEDLAILYFGGHGLKAQEGGLFLLTYDADMKDLEHTALSGKKLRDELAKVPCRVILILDACHSGALGPKQPPLLAKTKPVTDDLIRDLTDDDCGVVVWCSAQGHEKAQVNDKTGHGLFTLSLLKALDDKEGAPPSKYDNKVYLHHLQAYISDEVLYHSGQRQHPSLNLPWTVESFPLREMTKK